MESREVQKYIRMLDEKNDIGKTNKNKMKMGTPAESNPFASMLVLAIVSSLVVALIIVGLAINRYYAYFTRRKKDASELSYSVTRYWRRQLASSSCDSLTLSPLTAGQHQQPSDPNANEAIRTIKSSFSWPETTTLHQESARSPSTNSFSSLSSSSTVENFAEPASFTFGLRWNQTTGSLFIRVISARDLFIHRRNCQRALVDSYVRVELIPTVAENNPDPFQSMRTHIVKKSAHPVYDEVFEFTNIIQQISVNKLTLLFTIATYDTFTRDEVLGEIVFPLDGLWDTLESVEMTFTRDITPRHKQLGAQQLGQMLVSLCYQPADSTLAVVVLKASNLPKVGTARLINPYFKIYMFYKGQRIGKKRSSIKRTTQSPVYNECFTFHIPDNDILNIYLDIILFDYDRHMKHEPIGIFSIGNKEQLSMIETNQQHWHDVCHRQMTKQIAQWYQLKPFNGPTNISH